ncbi:MAG: TnsA endonuclease N-terminal domain-containing protein [Variovorax sp.]
MLEYDYLTLLKHDPEVAEFDVQPLKVQVPKGRPYTPDVLVHFHSLPSGKPRPSELTEVKPSHILEEDAEKNAPKFAAATALAHGNGWVFVTRTEDDVDYVRLRNIRKLQGFKQHPRNEVIHETLEDILAQHRTGMTVTKLMEATAERTGRVGLLSTLWRGVIERAFHMDFSQDITMDSIVKSKAHP